MYTRYFWQGNHHTYGHIRCVYMVLANPKLVSSQGCVVALRYQGLCSFPSSEIHKDSCRVKALVRFLIGRYRGLYVLLLCFIRVSEIQGLVCAAIMSLFLSVKHKGLCVLLLCFIRVSEIQNTRACVCCYHVFISVSEIQGLVCAAIMSLFVSVKC